MILPFFFAGFHSNFNLRFLNVLHKKDCIQYNLIKDIDSLFCLEVYYECKQIVYNLILYEVKIMIYDFKFNDRKGTGNS